MYTSNTNVTIAESFGQWKIEKMEKWRTIVLRERFAFLFFFFSVEVEKYLKSIMKVYF